MKKMKVMTVVGTRPELIKLCRVINELDMHTKHILVHTGQNYDYELNEIFFEELEIRKPNYFLNSTKDTNNANQVIGNIIRLIDDKNFQIKDRLSADNKIRYNCIFHFE